MDNYNTLDFHNKFNGTLPSQNGGPKHRLSDVDNPAFRIYESNVIPTGSLTDEFVANRLVHRRFDKSEHIFSNLYADSSKSVGYQQQFATIHQQPIIGYTLRSVKANGDVSKSHTLGRNGYLSKSQTLGRSSSPIATARMNPFGTVSRANFISSEGFSRRFPGSDKSAYISFFDIETDKVSTYQYRPGEDITGLVTIMVRKSLEIRFVQLIVSGHGQIVTRNARDGLPHTLRETYLHKEKCIIGAHDVLLSSVLTPGHYTSKFRVKLPTHLPSTIHHEDAANGFTFDITYTIRVRICDDVGTAPSRHSSSHSNRVRVFLEKQMGFNVQRGFDLNTVPDAMSPIIHTEQVHLSCAHQQAAIVSVNLDRAVFMAGDDIRMQLQVSLPSSQSVKEISCKLQEIVTTHAKHEPIVLTLTKIIRKDPTSIGGKLTNHKVDQNIFDVTIPTSTELISPYSLGNSQLKIQYFLAVELRFTPAGGKLSFTVPVGIGPCAEPIYGEKTSSKKVVPLFNRPTRFPCFSTKPLGSTTQRSSTPRSAASVQVTTKYSNGCFARCFLCCMGDGDP